MLSKLTYSMAFFEFKAVQIPQLELHRCGTDRVMCRAEFGTSSLIHLYVPNLNHTAFVPV